MPQSWLRLRAVRLAVGNGSTNVARPCVQEKYWKGGWGDSVSFLDQRIKFSSADYWLTGDESLKKAVAVSNNWKASFKWQEENPEDTANKGDRPCKEEEENDPCKTQRNKDRLKLSFGNNRDSLSDNFWWTNVFEIFLTAKSVTRISSHGCDVSVIWDEPFVVGLWWIRTRKWYFKLLVDRDRLDPGTERQRTKSCLTCNRSWH